MRSDHCGANHNGDDDCCANDDGANDSWANDDRADDCCANNDNSGAHHHARGYPRTFTRGPNDAASPGAVSDAKRNGSHNHRGCGDSDNGAGSSSSSRCTYTLHLEDGWSNDCCTSTDSEHHWFHRAYNITGKVNGCCGAGYDTGTGRDCHHAKPRRGDKRDREGRKFSWTSKGFPSAYVGSEPCRSHSTPRLPLRSQLGVHHECCNQFLLALSAASDLYKLLTVEVTKDLR